MESPTSKISIGQLCRQLEKNRQGYNNKYDMNTLCLTLPYSYASQLVDLNWYDISFAIDNGYFPHEVAVEHAFALMLEDEAQPQPVLDLICLYPEEIRYPHYTQPFVSELANAISEQEKSVAKQKLLYLVLNWYFEHREDYTDPLGVVELVYADFGYPKDVSKFVRYMPIPEPALDSTELSIARIYDKWRRFLETQKKLFAKT